MKTQNAHLKDIVYGIPATDGAGVKLNRIIGGYRLAGLDPFLLLDEIKSENPADFSAGFPEHPHRGFETVTYMLRGGFRHTDSRNGSGLLEPGGVQWMNAGRGVIHSEMPVADDGQIWGYQLWVNLPASRKQEQPRYQTVAPGDIPWIVGDGVLVKILAGSYGRFDGPVETGRDMNYFDVHLVGTGEFRQDEDMDDYSRCGYVHTGSVVIDPGGSADEIPAGSLFIPEPGRPLVVGTNGESAGFLYLSAPRLHEPVVRNGPFVMNTEAEIEQAFRDYREGRLGLE